MNTAFSLILKRDNFKKFLSLIKESGFDGFEPTFHPEGLPSISSFYKDAEVLRKESDNIGLKIPSMRGGPLFWKLFGSDKEEERKEAVNIAYKAMEALKIMGGDTLLIVPGRWNRGQSYLKLYKNCLETAKMIGEIAEKTNIIAGLENVENKFLFSPREWCEFIDEINNPYIRIYFDVGNVLYLDRGQPEDWIKDLGKRICRVHLKDCKDRKIVPPLEGDVNWSLVVKALKEIGYNSWLTVENPIPEESQGEFFKKIYSSVKKIWNM